MIMIIFLSTLTLLVLVLTVMVLYLYKNILISPKKRLLKHQDGLKSGSPYPLNILKTVEGHPLLKSTRSKGSVMIITSYGCEACKRVYPFLNQLEKEYRNIQFNILMLATKQQAQEYVDTYDLNNFQISLIKNEQLHALGITGFPFAYLLSKDGRVIQKGLVNHKKDFDLLISYLQYTSAS